MSLRTPDTGPSMPGPDAGAPVPASVPSRTDGVARRLREMLGIERWSYLLVGNWIDARFEDSFANQVVRNGVAETHVVEAGNRIPGIPSAHGFAELAWHGLDQRLAVGVGHHEDVSRPALLGDHGNQSIGTKPHRRQPVVLGHPEKLPAGRTIVKSRGRFLSCSVCHPAGDPAPECPHDTLADPSPLPVRSCRGSRLR